MRRNRCFSLALAAAGLAALPCPPAAAQTPAASTSSSASSTNPRDVARAETLAAEAFEAYGQKQHQRAVELYQQALAIADSADILFNIARVYDRGLEDRDQALEYYTRYVEHHAALAPRIQAAQARMRELRAATHASAAPPAPAAPAAGVVPSDASAPASPSAAWSTREWAAVLVGGSGVVAAGVGAGFGWSAYSDRDVWRRDCAGNECSSQRAIDAAHSATRKANIATLALISGGVLLGTGAVLWWTRGAPDTPESTALRLEPLTGSGLGCALSGRF